VLAGALATVRWSVEGRAHRVAGAALRALGRPAGRLARWRFAWALLYHRETDLLLALLAERLTAAWAAGRVACAEPPPVGGAILITLHHANKRLALPTLRALAPAHTLGVVAATPTRYHGDAGRDLRTFATETGVPLDLVAPISAFLEQHAGAAALLPQQAARRGLPLLREGGWLVIAADPQRGDDPNCVILGRALALPRGPIWLAERSGRPIVPHMIVPDRKGWRLWIGSGVEPTAAAVARAIEACIRRAPACCGLEWWEEWCRAPLAYTGRDGESA